jgi:hypothetical protein
VWGAGAPSAKFIKPFGIATESKDVLVPTAFSVYLARFADAPNFRFLAGSRFVGTDRMANLVGRNLHPGRA